MIILCHVYMRTVVFQYSILSKQLERNVCLVNCINLPLGVEHRHQQINEKATRIMSSALSGNTESWKYHNIRFTVSNSAYYLEIQTIANIPNVCVTIEYSTITTKVI